MLICWLKPGESLTNRILYKCKKSTPRCVQGPPSPIPQNTCITTCLPLYWRRLAFIRILKQGKSILCMMKGLPMDLLLSSSFFLPYLKRQALWLSHINLFFIASALSILLLDDLSLSDYDFPYKANNAKWDITIDHHFYT